MNIFILLAGLVFVGLFLVTFVAIVVVWRGVRKRSGLATGIRLGLCALPLAAFFLLCAWILGPADYHRPQDLAAAYQTEFGNLPPSDAVVMQARQVVVGDSAAAWLKFRASRQTIDNLLAKFAPSNSSTFSEAGVGANVPNWWTPGADNLDAFYTAEHWSKSSGSSTAYMGINRERGIVYFSHRVSD